MSLRNCAASLGCLVLLAGCGPSTKLTNINSVPPTTTSVALSATSFNFGENLVNNSVVQTVVTVTNSEGIPLTLNPVVSGTAGFSIVSAQSCGTQLNPGSSCPVVVNYTPTVASAPASQTATLNLNFTNAVAGSPSTVTLTGTSAAMSAGTVTQTANPLVAQYTITPPFSGNVTISFGQTDSYGRRHGANQHPAAAVQLASMLPVCARIRRITCAPRWHFRMESPQMMWTMRSRPAFLSSILPLYL